MGMAASQARFLGLTARKSNVEYQVQQINQQRTSLANESAGLYNQMMELSVPTPPAVSSFVSTSYVLDDTATYNNSNYKITNMQKTYEEEGQYSVSLSSTKTQYKATTETFIIIGTSIGNPSEKDGSITYSATLSKDGASGISLACVRNPILNDDKTPKTDEDGNPLYEIASAFVDGKLSPTVNQVYPIDDGKGASIMGYNEVVEDMGKDEAKYFYNDGTKNHFLSQAEFDALFGENNDNSTVNQEVTFGSTYAYNKEIITEVKARLEQSSNGRLSSIIIEENDEYPEELSGKIISLSAVQETDQDAYDQAMNDYEYEKAMYEKAISDINSKTETIQAKDQSLELKIQQLDTEQNAIATEMESVKKVIEDNVDSTFKIFA